MLLSGIKIKYRTMLSVALASIALLVSATDSANAAGMLIADGGFGGIMEIRSHEVVVTINNGVAVTEVTQVFRNTEDRTVEALYTFPVPKGASVSNFSMWIAGKEMIGEVVEKKRARQIYESYKTTRRDPGLLEQVDYKTFEMRIFPIGPKAEQKVKIRYYQETDCDNDWLTYVYPLSTVAGKRGGSTTVGKFSLSLHAKSLVPISEMSSPSHSGDFVIAKHGDNYYQASLEVNGGDLNRDVVLAYRMARPKTGLDMICWKEGAEDGYFCLTLTAGKELEQANGPMDYVFVLDISGSMSNRNKLIISRDCIDAFISELGKDDRFEIIAFNVRPTTLFSKLSSADEKAMQNAKEFLASRKAAGGTVLRPALQTAYKYRSPDRPLNVVVLSDGMTEQAGRQQLMNAINSRPENVRVFCVGVGNEVNRPLLNQIANDSGGLASFLSQGDDFQRQARAFRRKLMKPAMIDVSLKFAGGGIYDVEPRKIPNLYHGSPVRIYGRYRNPGKASVTLQAAINGNRFSRDAELLYEKHQEDNPEIRRMWAWRRINSLLEQPSFAGRKSPGIVEEVVRLGEGYSIATQYTSFIVLENDAEYKRWRIDRRNSLLIRKDRAARNRLMENLQNMQNESLAALGPGGAEEKKRETKVAPTPRQPAGRSNTNSPSFELPNLFPKSGGPVGLLSLSIIGILAGDRIIKRRRNRK